MSLHVVSPLLPCFWKLVDVLTSYWQLAQLFNHLAYYFFLLTTHPSIREELDEKVNYLEVEDVTPYLTFNKEEEGLYTLRGGPLDALIAYAASTSSAGESRDTHVT